MADLAVEPHGWARRAHDGLVVATSRHGMRARGAVIPGRRGLVLLGLLVATDDGSGLNGLVYLIVRCRVRRSSGDDGRGWARRAHGWARRVRPWVFFFSC